MIIEDKHYSDDDQEKLIHDWFEGSLSPESIMIFRAKLQSPEFAKEVGRYALLSGYLRDQGGYIRDESTMPVDTTSEKVDNEPSFSKILSVADISQLYDMFEQKSRPRADLLIRRMRFHTISMVLLIFVSVTTLAVIFGYVQHQKNMDHRQANQHIAVSLPPHLTDGEPKNEDNTNYPGFNTSTNGNNKTDLPIIAVLRNVINVDWGNKPSITQGELLRARHLEFESGFLMVDFLSGVRMIVEGPADLDLKSENEVYVSKGKMSCHVTEFGRGFKIYTKEMDVIDLGTRFGLEVNGNSKPEIHVLEGKVLLQTGMEEQAVEIQEKEARRWDQGELTSVAFAPERFTQPGELASINATAVQKKFQSWREWCDMLHRDNSVILHYTASRLDKETNVLQNTVTGPKAASNGTLIGCSYGTNRWGNGESIDFRTPIDRVLFKVPGEHNMLTFLVWARVDALINEYNALIDCEEQRIWEANLPEKYKPKPVKPPFLRGIRWEIRKNGRMQFSVCHGTDKLIGDLHDIRNLNNIGSLFDWDRYVSPEPIVQPESFGQWCFLAVTYDTKRKLVTQYYNGKQVHEAVLEKPVSVPLSFVNIGNCGEPFDVQQFRLVGSFDEVMILDRVLSTSEIARIGRMGSR